MKPIHKIVILGGESTGKSTLCKQLSDDYNTVWVQEYAREYFEKNGNDYVEKDLLAIAKGQCDSEDKQLRNANNYLICDTDLHVIKIWSEHKYNTCAAWILDQLAVRTYDAYLITSPDFPWEEDPLREHPEEHMRNYFFKQYIDIAINTNKPFCIVAGNETQRFHDAKQFIQKTFQ